MQSNCKCISAQIRVIGKSRLNRKKTNNYFNSETSYDFHILYWLIFYTYRTQGKNNNNNFEATYDFHILYFPYLPFTTENKQKKA